MMTLYSFGPAFGLPDPSPFVTKADILLKMSGLPYRTDTGGFKKAPKGKLPYIADDGELIADSTFIRWHLEKKYGIDFDRGLDPDQRAVAWAFEKMLEESLYFVGLSERWMIDGNFDKGPARFFRSVPAPLRPLVVAMIRRSVRRNLYGQGTGRHSFPERHRIGVKAIDSVADYLGAKPFFMGSEPHGIDATVFAFMTMALCPLFDTPLRDAAERHDNIRRYVARMSARYYPEETPGSGKAAA